MEQYFCNQPLNQPNHGSDSTNQGVNECSVVCESAHRKLAASCVERAMAAKFIALVTNFGATPALFLIIGSIFLKRLSFPFPGKNVCAVLKFPRRTFAIVGIFSEVIPSRNRGG